MKKNIFAAFSNDDLAMWLAQYAGKQSGFYPSARKVRLAAEREWQTRTEKEHAWLDTRGVIPQYPVDLENTKFWLKAKREA